jgi:hypothetical protein
MLGFSRCELLLVAEAGESSGTRKGVSAFGSRYQATTSEDVTGGARVCVTAYSKV